MEFHVRLGQKVDKGDVLFTLHSESKGELEYALEFLRSHPDAVRVESEAISAACYGKKNVDVNKEPG